MKKELTNEHVQARIKHFCEKQWSYQEVHEWYGINVSEDPQPGASQSLLNQYRFWAEKRASNDGPDLDRETLNRMEFELFLQHRGLISLRMAAIQLGMFEDSLRKTLAAAKNAGLVTSPEADGEFPSAGVYRASLVGDLHYRFPAIANMTFPTYSSFCRRLHECIRVELGLDVQPALCPTSVLLEDDPPEVGHDLDVITQAPIGLPYQLWLDTGKSMQLRPDACSWLTYLKHEAALESFVSIEKDTHLDQRRHGLQQKLGC